MTRPLVSWRRSSGLAVGLAAVSLMLAGCVNLPGGGTIGNVKELQNSDVGSQLVITPRAPGSQWQPQQIVSGFLVASGANPDDLSVARDYLSGNYAKAWRPKKASPNVIDTGAKVSPPAESPSRITGGQSSAQVTVTSQHLQTLVPAGKNEAGRLQLSRGPAPYVFRFELIQFGGKWRIDAILGPNGKPSNSILLLTDSDFQRDYLPRNLYYLARGPAQTLVPYPVYIPAQTGQLGGVRQLVEALPMVPPTGSNWLYHAIDTAFPPHTTLTVQVLGSNAVVSLSGVRAKTDLAGQLSEMEAQLVWTLTYAPDSPGGTGITSVQLRIGHRKSGVLRRSQQFANWVPQGPAGPLFFQALGPTGLPLLEHFSPSISYGSRFTSQSGGAAKPHGLAGVNPAHEPLPAGLGSGPLTAMAVSPEPPGGASYFAGCRGKTVYVAPLLVISDLQSAELPANCTSLSWDNQGDLWAIAGSDLYAINATISGLGVIPVSIPTQQIAQSDKFVSLKVAPDGLRVAMIVRGKHSTSVYVAAITKREKRSVAYVVYLAQGGPVLTVGPDLINPVALAWWDSDHLLVLDRQRGVAQLNEVPVNGGGSTKVLTPPNAISVTANGAFVAVGTPGSNGQPTVLVSHGLEGPWLLVDPGSTPTYAG